MNGDRMIINYGQYVYHINLFELDDVRVDDPAFDDRRIVLWAARVNGRYQSDPVYRITRFTTGLYPTKLDALNAALMSLTTLADADTESRKADVMST